MPRSNWLLFAGYLLLTLGVLVASFLSPAVRGVAYAPLREALLPPPPPIVVTLLYSTEKEGWLEEVATRFEASQATVNGRPVRLALEPAGSREMVLSILDDTAKPDLISPASSLQIAMLEELSASRFGQPVVRLGDTRACRSVVTTPLVLVAWRERAEVLWGDAPDTSLWRDLHDALVDPQGWARYGKPEWGYVKFGHTSPLSSNSGFQTILLMTYSYFDKTSDLTSADLLGDAAYQQWFQAVKGTISTFGDSTGRYMEEMVAYGPSRHDLVAVYEATAIQQADNARGRYGELRVYYPPATSLSDHPFCLLTAGWVTAEKAAAQQVLEFLATPAVQELALFTYGFRPAAGGPALEQPGSPFTRYPTLGLRPDLPPAVETPSGDVLTTLLDFWTRTAQP